MKTIRFNNQEKALLSNILLDYLEKTKPLIKNNRVIKRDYVYMRKLLTKLSIKSKRCPTCGRRI